MPDDCGAVLYCTFASTLESALKWSTPCRWDRSGRPQSTAVLAGLSNFRPHSLIVAKRKTRLVKRTPKTASSKSAPPITSEVVHRLEKLAGELEAASKEATEVAEIVRTDLADELTKHLGNGDAKKKAD
jgi:hypothetical protein